MEPTRSPAGSEPKRRALQRSGTGSRSGFRIAFALCASLALSACEQNSFVPPPAPKVEVAVPVQRTITRFLEATGNTAPIKSVDLVARVQGVLQSIDYLDGSFVKE